MDNAATNILIHVSWYRPESTADKSQEGICSNSAGKTLNDFPTAVQTLVTVDL